ncbi:MAG: hypothetical protein WBE68_02625 [Candidatus Nitrosopolaris sp.]
MTSNKHTLPEALIGRYILLRVEQKIEFFEIARFYDADALRTIFEPIGESIWV